MKEKSRKQQKKNKERQKEAKRAEAIVTGSSLHNTPCNRFYNNYVINICPRKLLKLI